MATASIPTASKPDVQETASTASHTPLYRFNSLQVGRGIAALGVVLFHTVSLLTHSVTGFRYPYFSPACSGVDYFFVLSGFIIMNAHRKDLGHPSRLRSFLYRRLIRIYPLYLLLTLVMIALYSLHLGHFFKLNAGIIAKSFVLFPQEPGIKPLLAPGWTLCHEALFYLICAALIFWGPRVRWTILSVIGVLTFINCLTSLPGPYWVHTWLFSPYNFEFAAGCVANLVVSRRLWWTSFAGVGLLLTAWFVTVRYSLPTTDPVHMIIWFGLPYFLIVMGATSFEISRALTIPRPLLALGDATYSIYLSHFVVVSAMVALCTRLSVPVSACLIAIPAIAVAVGFLLYGKVERPILSYMRSLGSARGATLPPQ